MARVLLVEDHTQLAVPIVRELEQEYGHDVTWARDPLEAAERLSTSTFDVAVVDMLYEHLTREFDRRRLSREVSLGADRLLITGLYAVAAFRRTRACGGIVMWTSGEANRRLHLLFAHESLGVRAFCSKSAGTGRADVLAATIAAAHEDDERVDPVLNAYLPALGSPEIGATLLRDARTRAIWRALALGHHTRDEIAAVTGYAERSIGNVTRAMLDGLVELDPGLRPGRRPLPELVSFASRNWEFFLDEAVRAGQA